jgi:hypothetical protein
VTRLQAIGINGHFMVEQGARSTNRLFMNFNGTAGIFRKEAIIDAGNWQGDTLTEDMDLSYRMQLCGWECRYLIDLVAPAEIPRDLNAFKSQQFRWAKGSTQTAIKLMPRILAVLIPAFCKISGLHAHVPLHHSPPHADPGHPGAIPFAAEDPFSDRHWICLFWWTAVAQLHRSITDVPGGGTRLGPSIPAYLVPVAVYGVFWLWSGHQQLAGGYRSAVRQNQCFRADPQERGANTQAIQGQNQSIDFD